MFAPPRACLIIVRRVRQQGLAFFAPLCVLSDLSREVVKYWMPFIVGTSALKYMHQAAVSAT